MYEKLFVFDVESIGLHGEGFAVAGGVYSSTGEPESEFVYACPPGAAAGNDEDRQWIAENVPSIPLSHAEPLGIRNAFWNAWLAAKQKYPKIIMAAECGWPVEARFLMACIDDSSDARRWQGPYPLAEISSYMAASGMDPMVPYERVETELPAHNPLGDARLSARLFCQAINKLL